MTPQDKPPVEGAVERLTASALFAEETGRGRCDSILAADLRLLLTAYKERAEALEPFAAMTDLLEGVGYDDGYTPDWSPFVPVGAYRRARTALSPSLKTGG